MVDERFLCSAGSARGGERCSTVTAETYRAKEGSGGPVICKIVELLSKTRIYSCLKNGEPPSKPYNFLTDSVQVL